MSTVIFESIKSEIQLYCNIIGIVKKLNSQNSHKSKLAGFDKDIEEILRDLKRIDTLKQAVFEYYADKTLTNAEYKFAIGKYNEKTENLKLRLETAKADKEKYTLSSTPQNKWIIAISKFVDCKELTYEMAHELIERIEISVKNKVTIMFKFRDELQEIKEFSGVSL